jgi:hypothetical protein
MVSGRQKNSFAKKQLKIAPGILFFPLSIDAAGDPPHNDSSGVTCTSCHGQSLILVNPQGGEFPHPLWDTGISVNEAYNAICLRCHVTVYFKKG